jgi:hypothetical protein
MKKYLLLVMGFFVCSHFLFAELKKAQMWAISLTGILSEINSSYRNSLNTSAMDEGGKNSILELLRRDWGITTRGELLETLISLENRGHTASLSEIQKIRREIIDAKSESALGAVFSKYEWDQTKFNRFKYISSNWERYNNHTIRAWDLGRSISLCRWGYNVGFINEEEAWEKIFHIAKIIQSLYNSWEDYGYDYFIGRLFWASGFGEEEAYFVSTEPVYKRLLNSYWSWIDWDIDLDLPETNEIPVTTIRFLKPDDNDGTLQYRTNDEASYDSWSHSYRQNPNVASNTYEYWVKKKSGNTTSGFGILFCVDNSESGNTSFYRFLITVNGRYVIQKRIGSTWADDPIGWRNSPFINTGYDVYNKLRVERVDNKSNTTFNIYINDNLAASFNDDNPINGNRIGLVAATSMMEREQFPYIPVDIRFDFMNNNIEMLVFRD